MTPSAGWIIVDSKPQLASGAERGRRFPTGVALLHGRTRYS